MGPSIHTISARRRSQLRTQLLAWHLSECPLDDRAIDRLLGINSTIVEKRLTLRNLKPYSGDYNLRYEGVPYAVVRAVLRWAKVDRRDVFYDLGAGHGRTLFYGALTTPARFCGIEIVPQRLAAMNLVRQRLGLDSVAIRGGNVCDEPFEDGTIFFLFNPFFRPSLRRVGERLGGLARHKSLRIATVAIWEPYFATRPWLREDLQPVALDTVARRYGLRLFSSH